jgi:hypothetical protein
MGMTPFREQGVEVRFEQTSDGAAVRFTVTPDPTPARVESLRERVAGWASRHNEVQTNTAAASAAPNEASECTNGGPAVPRSNGSAQPIEDGARLRFIAVDAREIAELRARVNRYAERVKNGACRMIGQP